MKKRDKKMLGLFMAFFGGAVVLAQSGAIEGFVSLCFLIGGCYLIFSE